MLLQVGIAVSDFIITDEKILKQLISQARTTAFVILNKRKKGKSG